MKYIHVGRDGRDACMSLHNHGTGLSAQVLEDFDKIGVEDETIGHPFPTGRLAPKPSGGRRHAKLDPHRGFLIGRITEKADMTMPELAAELEG